MNYHVYILFSELKDRFYIGYTSHLEVRLDEHNAGKTPSTKFGRPWKLVYSEVFQDKSSASKREMEIKSKESRKYIASLIKSKG